VTHQSSVELASREQVAMTLNDSNAVSCTVPVFAGNDAVLFPGIQEWIMTGIPGRPGMHSLPGSYLFQELSHSTKPNLRCQRNHVHWTDGKFMLVPTHYWRTWQFAIWEHQLRLFLVIVYFQSRLIVSKNRAALSPTNVNKLVCLNNWLGL